jgi:hypothetical protein
MNIITNLKKDNVVSEILKNNADWDLSGACYETVYSTFAMINMKIMLQFKNANKLSNSLQNELDTLLKSDFCETYKIYKVIESFIIEQNISSDLNLEVAYGYLKTPTNTMTRHCFLVNNRTAIVDPKLGCQGDKLEYHIFKILNVKEYIDLLNKFYENNPRDRVATMAGLIPEERDYCEYVINNNIIVDKASYVEFLSQYDIYRSVKYI